MAEVRILQSIVWPSCAGLAVVPMPPPTPRWAGVADGDRRSSGIHNRRDRAPSGRGCPIIGRESWRAKKTRSCDGSHDGAAIASVCLPVTSKQVRRDTSRPFPRGQSQTSRSGSSPEFGARDALESVESCGEPFPCARHRGIFERLSNGPLTKGFPVGSRRPMPRHTAMRGPFALDSPIGGA